jgi:RimJ/RimL family protein N-acetyltransferase
MPMPKTPSVPPSAAQPRPDLLPWLGRRVVLRRLAGADLADFQAYRHDEQLGRYQGWTAQADDEALGFLSRMNTVALLQPGEWCQIAIACRDTGSLIGDIGLCVAIDAAQAEIGFTLCAPSQGRGLGTDAVRTAIAWLFEHTPAAQVVGITDARNGPSVRLLERVGMRRVATADTVFRGEPCTEHVYAVSRHDGAWLLARDANLMG